MMLAWKIPSLRGDPRVHRLCLFLLAMLALGALMACSEQQRTLNFKSTDITGTTIGGDFAMTDHTGQPRKLSDYKGKVVLLFFGFTHCPDVCPTTLSEVAAAMKVLGEKSNDVQVLFVTVDPERDTQELLAQYVPAFDPRFVALRGANEELEVAAKQFKVFYRKVPTPSGTYTMDHTAGTFVLDRQGRLRLLIPYGAGVDVVSHDIAQLLG
jgi:protein SCO1/2